MHVSTEETKVKDAEVAEEFKRYFPHIRFENVMTSYRDIIQPTVEFVSKVAEEAIGKGNTVTVLVPQFIPKNIGKTLHNQMSLKLKYALRWHEEVVVASYSYHLSE